MTYITFQNAIFAQNITFISELRPFDCIYIFFMLAEMLCEVHKEFVNAARRETCSVLRARGYNAMSTLSFTEIIKEIQTLQTSEFQEKERKEISLPGKKANEVKELLQVIYPIVERKPPNEIKDENCHYLLSLVHEYQIEAISQRCEDFIVKTMKESFSAKKNPDIIAELVFAQT